LVGAATVQRVAQVEEHGGSAIAIEGRDHVFAAGIALEVLDIYREIRWRQPG
jgi:hypothetical protein